MLWLGLIDQDDKLGSTWLSACGWTSPVRTLDSGSGSEKVLTARGARPPRTASRGSSWDDRGEPGPCFRVGGFGERKPEVKRRCRLMSDVSQQKRGRHIVETMHLCSCSHGNILQEMIFFHTDETRNEQELKISIGCCGGPFSPRNHSLRVPDKLWRSTSLLSHV